MAVNKVCIVQAFLDLYHHHHFFGKMSMLKPEHNPYSRQYKGPPMCSCCNTLLAIELKDLCHSCQGLSIPE
jgi:hypothetical protein